MRTHGWGGDTPRSDDEACTRIVEAARRVVLDQGRSARLAEVARELGVSRATVYRYYADSEALLDEMTRRETGPFLNDITTALHDDARPEDAVVHAVAYVVRNLPKNPILVAAFAGDNRAARAASITSPMAQDFGRAALSSLQIDWAEAGFDDDNLSILVEQMLRMVQSFLLDPEPAGHPGLDLETYLRIWLVPTIRLITECPDLAASFEGNVSTP